MTLFVWHLRRTLAALGLPGGVALLIGAGLALHWTAIERPSTTRSAQLQQEVAVLEARLRTAPPRPAGPAARGDALLQAYDARFPDMQQVTGVVSRVHASALQSGVTLERGEFKLERTAAEPLQRYVMLLPARGSYRALRRFMREVLRDQPAIALDEIAFRRPDPQLPQVQAQLRLVLYVTADVTAGER